MGGDEDECALIREVGGEGGYGWSAGLYVGGLMHGDLHRIGGGQGREGVLGASSLVGDVVYPGLLGVHGALNLLALVVLKPSNEGATRGDGPAGPGEHPGRAARPDSGDFLLFLLFGSDLHTATLAGGENWLGVFAIESIGTVRTIRDATVYPIDAISAIDPVNPLNAVQMIFTVFDGNGHRFWRKDGLWLFGDLLQDAFAGFRRRRHDVRNHRVGGEIALQFGDFAAAEVAGFGVNLGLPHAVFRQELEGEED